jgi:hypothetical protein
MIVNFFINNRAKINNKTMTKTDQTKADSHISYERSVENDIVTETKKRKLGRYEFHCQQCNTIHQMSAYAIAQQTMGHGLLFKCTCGNKIEL